MNKQLAERAVACPRWRWLPGMRSVSHGGHSRRLDPPSNARGLHPWWTWSQGECGEGLPDLSDPATVGCLLALVREAWGDRYVYAMRLNVRRQIWVVHVPSDRHNIHGEGETEAEALVAALEAAP